MPPAMSIAPPLPPTGSFVKAIRDSSRSLRLAANISIQKESIKRLLLSQAFTESFQRVSASHGLAFPLNFPSVLAELNLLSILCLLNFASGYRVPLHAETGRGAWDNIRAFVFSLYLTSSVGDAGDLLSAKGMQGITEGQVAELMRVDVHVERPHDTIPGLTIGELGGPMHELVKLVTGALNETGRILTQQGYPDLGSFVLQALAEAEKVNSSSSIDKADFILERLVTVIPTFRDMGLVDGQPIYCFKKALFLIHAITVRFGSLTPLPFPVPSSSGLPIFADNVIPSLLIHLGVIDLTSSPTLAAIFPTNAEMTSSFLEAAPPRSDAREVPRAGPLLSSDQAYVLRAAAIDACELIVEMARTSSGDAGLGWIRGVTLPQLDMWLWAVAKDRADYRQLGRFVLTGTTYF